MSTTREEKIQQIKELFSKLYCFTSDEIYSFMKETTKFPDEGIDKLLALLLDGKKQQDDFLTHRLDEDKEYGKNLSHFLKKTTGDIKESYEKTEHESAESMLNNM